MNGWIETAAVVILSVLGCLIGRWFAKLPQPYWMIGYLIPAGVVFLIWLGRSYSGLELVPPISWLVGGRTTFAICGLLATMMLVIPLSRVKNARMRRLVWVFVFLFVADSCVWPFAASALNREYLLSLKTHIDRDGVCRQSTDYNCGPAAAVTALHRLNFPAEEGEIAAAAHTSRAMGTPPGILFSTLETLYQKTDLHCEYRHFKDVAELRGAGVTIAVIKFGLLVDHYVTVLEVKGNQVIIGDPLQGRVEYSSDEFARKWRYLGIVLRRDPDARVERKIQAADESR